MTARANRVETANYSLEFSPDGQWASLFSPDGRLWAQLCLITAFDTVGAPDETLGVSPPEWAKPEWGHREWPDAEWPVRASEATTTVTVRRRSSQWQEAQLVVECQRDAIVFTAAVRGRGQLATISLLGGRSLMPDRLGFLKSGSVLATLFSPNPEDPRQLLRDGGRPAVIGVTGDSRPGRGHWFFTPAPFYLALTDATEAGAPRAGLKDGRGWLGLGLLEPIEELDCTHLAYVPADQSFHLELDYEGHHTVEEDFAAPAVVFVPGTPDPYSGLRDYRHRLIEKGFVPRRPTRVPASWWSRPMFCGWGAQCYLASVMGTRPQEQCSQENYERFLAELATHDLVPGTVVVDDGWQSRYGQAVPDGVRWLDLKGWIAARHSQGQRVLMWWKAWDASGVPEECCIKGPDGSPVAIDPAHPAAAQLLSDNITTVLAATELDADGLKVDFTGRTPTGYGLRSTARWGISLLHELLAQIYRAAKTAKADALIITHAANPGFIDVTDMVRLNDILRLDEVDPESPVVEQMRYRAGVVKAACPELLIDTDDWCAPDLHQWREYLSVKGQLGVPALYYTTHLDRTGEALEEQDYAALRALWARQDSGTGHQR